MQGLAQRYLVQALTMARFAGDEGLGGEILAAMSHQAAYVAQPEHAIDMALAAQLAGRRAGLPVLETESIVMEAHGHALRSDAGSCSRAYDVPRRSSARRPAVTSPHGSATSTRPISLPRSLTASMPSARASRPSNTPCDLST